MDESLPFSDNEIGAEPSGDSDYDQVRLVKLLIKIITVFKFLESDELFEDEYRD